LIDTSDKRFLLAFVFLLTHFLNVFDQESFIYDGDLLPRDLNRRSNIRGERFPSKKRQQC
jgi:hypothetical protein